MPEHDPLQQTVEDDHDDGDDADDDEASCKPCMPNGKPFLEDLRLSVQQGYAKDGEKKDLIFCPGKCGAGFPFPYGVVSHLTSKLGANCIGMKFKAPWTGGGE